MTGISDSQIATAIAKLHADDATSLAELVELVVAFLRQPKIDDAELLSFRAQIARHVQELGAQAQREIDMDE